VLVLVRPAGVFRVVEVDAGEVLEPDDVVELRDRLRDRVGRREIVARREGVGGVETDFEVPCGPVEDGREVLERAAEFRPATGVRFDEHRHALGDVEFVERARRVVEALLDAGAGVGTQVDVDVLDAQRRGGLDLCLHAPDRLLPKTALRRREVHQVGGVDDPRADVVFGRQIAKRRGLVLAQVRLAPYLRGVGEELSTVALQVDLLGHRVVDAAGG
jgi:hypothetical protein